MYTIHEGDVILKEKYGSSPRERFYVKPPEQGNIVILDEQHKLSNITGWFTRIFLPQGYPDSVSKDYLPYQIWDTAQAFCSTITGILATQEVLRGVGVGDTSATPLAATITWVIKDGCGHIGRILFAFSHGTYLDAYSKKWRLYADTLNDAAMCIEIALPLFKNYTTFALCVSTVMKAIVGVADLKIAGFQITLGASIRNIIKENPQAMHLRNIKDVYNERNYILLPDLSMRKMLVLIKEMATTDDILCAYFHAVLLSIVTCAINDEYSHINQNSTDPRPFALVCHMLQSAEWSREPVESVNNISRFSYAPSIELMRYVDKIVNKEWYITRAGMLHTGWDLSKHLLMVDEWRISGETIKTNEVASEERLSYSEPVVNTINKAPPPFRENLTASDINIISEDDCFTTDAENDLETSREKSRSKLRLDAPNQPSGTIILEATEVKPEIEEVKKE
ncbi:hypothetical protein MSG28_001044 [Choristoneura fumiferana]|uniref:Uncharacterized protein n=1 Tax=Choristoneura fumiferana TaxID=7141 RepID=A0ACC0K3H1_CHOFU|nr:hypothetical protein MSG28_001044 [Choristoneura fumiferana]